jgi:hypothetical protein
VKADAHAIELAPIMAEISASGAIKLQAVADELNARGVRTATGVRCSAFAPASTSSKEITPEPG